MAVGIRLAIVALLAVFAASAWIGVESAVAQDGNDYPHVLILYPGDERIRSTNIVGKALAERLAAVAPEARVTSEFLDLLGFPGEKYADKLAAFLDEKYSTERPDVIVALGPPALDFITKYRDTIAPEARIAFGLVETPRDFGPSFGRGEIAGVFGEYGLSKTMELASRLQPDARQVVVVAGASEFDRSWAETAREDLVPWAVSHEITYLEGLPFPDVINAVSHLSPDTIVLIPSFFEDGTGRRFVNLDAVSEIAGAATAPSYGPYDTYVGHGFVGGYSDSFASTGEALADLTLDLLGGPPDAVSDRTDQGSAYRVDARQLKRWNLPVANLPPETVVLFEEKSFWDQYREIAIAVIAILLVQSALVIGLLINRLARRRAERTLAEHDERMTQAAKAARIGLWHFDLPDGQFWTSAYCREMLGLDPAAEVTPAAILKLVHADDRSATEQHLHALKTGEPFIGEFRMGMPGGEVRWLQAISSVLANPDTGSQRISGIFKDISERRRASLEAEEQRNEVARISRVLMLGEMSWTIAHELNQPLTGILANAQAAQLLLAQLPATYDEALTALGEIVEDADRAGQVIQRLRGLLKKGEPRDGTRRHQRNLPLGSFPRPLGHHQSQDQCRHGSCARLAPVVGDPVQLQQVALNLLVNAMDAAASTNAPRSEIVIATRWKGIPGSLEATVTDNGPGITAENADQFFSHSSRQRPAGWGSGSRSASRSSNRMAAR